MISSKVQDKKGGRTQNLSNAGKGRAPGVPNKVTTEFRQTVQQLLDRNASNVQLWLQQVAEGHGDSKPAPDKALDLLAKLAEYAAPKLSRVDHTSGDKPMQLAPMIVPALKL